MHVFRFSSLGSTSDHAKELTTSRKCELPFAVVADEQTKGRGRQGSTWIGYKGNVHITFALPPSSTEKIGLVPLKAGVLVARAIENVCNLKIALKWPNDLMVHGQKVGGLLCETTIQGQEQGPLFIGIGINVEHFPTSMPDVEYLATSLQDQSIQKVDCETLINELVRLFCKWDEDSNLRILDEYKDWSIGLGQLFRDGKSFSLLDGYSDEGALLLRDLDSAKPKLKIVHSVDSGCEWTYRNPKTPLIVLDYGNTNLKFAVFKDSHQKYPAEVLKISQEKVNASHELAQSVRKFVDERVQVPRGFPIYTMGGNPSGILHLRKELSSVFSIVTLAKRTFRYQGSYSLASIGSDRLAMIENALARRCFPSVLVSAGTAITIDVLDAKGIHLGGWILPGLQMRMNALNEGTAALPKLKFEYSGSFDSLGFGQTTDEAILFGTLGESSAAINFARSILEERLHIPSEDLKVILTGGDSKYFSHFGTRDEHAIIEGIRLFVLGG